jgi:selenocysteine lyase/cysteine desulfurase/class 3 adenylate cyclase
MPNGEKPPYLNMLPAQVLLGLRDATSAALGVSITFTDAYAQPVAIEPFHIGRRFTVRACQLFHCRHESPIKPAICDIWDRDAADFVRSTGESFDRTCGLGYSGTAVPVYVDGAIDALILAGERRLSSRTTAQNDSDYERAKAILADADAKQVTEHRHEWLRACEPPFTLSEEEWIDIKDSLQDFAQFLGAFVDAFRSHKSSITWSSKTIDLVANSRELRRVAATALEKLASDTRLRVLSILAAGFPASNQWLWEFHDPEVLDPSHSAKMERLSFVLFADIRGFSEACEAEGPHAVDRARREILTPAMDLVKQYGGILDKFIGDALLAYFFAPTVPGVASPHAKDEELIIARKVAECALELQKLSTSSSGRLLEFGIGVTYGELFFGQFWYEGRLALRREITGIGSVVNKAQRISSLARKRASFKQRPAVLLDAAARRRIKESFDCPREDIVRLKGFGLENYEPIYSIRSPHDIDSDDARPSRARTVNLSQGSLSVPPSHVIDAFQDYYDHLKHTKEQLPLGDPQLSLPGKLAAVLSCNEGALTFRASTTACIEDALANYRDHYRLHRAPSDPSISRRVVLMTDMEHPAIEDAVIQRYPIIHRVALAQHPKALGALTVLRAFERALVPLLRSDAPPAVILFPHISWATGVRFPIDDIAAHIRTEYARAKTTRPEVKQPLIVVDGAHALGHVPVKLSVRETLPPDYDIYATSAHKWLRGPHGVGIMYVSPRARRCRQCTQRYAAGDVFTCTAGLGAQFVGQQSRTHDRAKAYACLAALNHQVGMHPAKWADERFKRIMSVRERIWAVLSDTCKLRLSAPKPAPDMSTGILTVFVPRASILEHQKLQQALEDEGVIVDALSDRPGLRVCLHPELDDEDIEYAISTFIKTLRPQNMG